MRQVRKTSRMVSLGKRNFSIPPSWWRYSAVGYLAACIMAAVGIGFTILEESLLAHSYFSASLLLLATLLVSHFWGVGPGLLTALLGCVALSVFLVLPQSGIASVSLRWELVFRFIPFAIASLIVAMITGQREAARQLLQRRARDLEQANYLKDAFLIRAAHELRTPLTTILGETQLRLRRLNQGENAEADCRNSLAKIEARAKYLRTLIEDLLEISRLRSYEIPLRLAPCDFGNLCRKVVNEQQAFFGRKIVVQVPSQPLIFYADDARLSQAITHLVENALHYSFEGAAVHLDVSADERSILLQVTNEGIGLSPEQQELVFEPFYRTPLAQEVFPRGWGLGLTISKEIVERHNGQIWVETTEGKEITFCVRIPFSNKGH